MTLSNIASDRTPVHIASVALYVKPNDLTNVLTWLHTEKAEIYANDHKGKLVVVLEASWENGITQFIDAANNYPGIIQAALVYHEIVEDF